MKLYLLILHWKNKFDTFECLNSLKNLASDRIHILVVDNGSEDNLTVAIENNFSGIEILTSKVNLGYAEGNNIGIRYCLEHGADYIFLLNNDTVVPYNIFDELIKIIKNNPDIGILCPVITSFYNRSIKYIGAKWDTKTGQGIEIVCSPCSLPDLVETDYAPGCALLIRSSVIQRIGYFNNKYFAYFEDTDLSFRCKRAGYKVMVATKTYIYHKGTTDNGKKEKNSALYYYWRNCFLFMHEYGPIPSKYLYTFRYIWQLIGMVRENNRNGQDYNNNPLINGTWAGITNQYYDRVVEAPYWFTTLIIFSAKQVHRLEFVKKLLLKL